MSSLCKTYVSYNLKSAHWLVSFFNCRPLFDEHEPIFRSVSVRSKHNWKNVAEISSNCSNDWSRRRLSTHMYIDIVLIWFHENDDLNFVVNFRTIRCDRWSIQMNASFWPVHHPTNLR